jgi:Ca2+-binding RTX toxin-like protein
VYKGIEHIEGSRFNDTITGDSKANIIFGGAGDDVFYLSGGADTLFGGSGSNDSLYLGRSSGKVSLFQGAGNGRIVLDGIENLYGSMRNDNLTGNFANNILEGNGGDDVLSGFGGDDHLMGSAGRDKLFGGRGDDRLVGGAGADTMAGAIAAKLGASRLFLLTDVPGVLDKNKRLLTDLTPEDIAGRTADGTISGGMIPKLETCVHAVEAGCEAAVVLDGRVPHAMLLEIFTARGAGTLIHR